MRPGGMVGGRLLQERCFLKYILGGCLGYINMIYMGYINMVGIYGICGGNGGRQVAAGKVRFWKFCQFYKVASGKVYFR